MKLLPTQDVATASEPIPHTYHHVYFLVLLLPGNAVILHSSPCGVKPKLTRRAPTAPLSTEATTTTTTTSATTPGAGLAVPIPNTAASSANTCLCLKLGNTAAVKVGGGGGADGIRESAK